MTPADLSALIEELEKMEKQLREQVCRNDCDVQPCPTLKQAADLLSRCRDALRGGVMVPRGWQLVPKEATDEMVIANSWASDKVGGLLTRMRIREDYKAMLSAAPQAGGKEGK